MSVTEKFKNQEASLEAKRKAYALEEALEEARKDAAKKAPDKDRLKDCLDLLSKFGINQALVDINRDLLSNKGKITQFSGVDEGSYLKQGDYLGDGSYEHFRKHYRSMTAKTRLEWFDDNAIDVEVSTDADDEKYNPYKVEFSTGDTSKSIYDYHFWKILTIDTVQGQEHKALTEHNSFGKIYSTEELIEAFEDVLVEMSFSLKDNGRFTPKIPKRRGLFGRM